MDFSNLKINCNRLPKIFSKNSLAVTDIEVNRIEELLLKEEEKGRLTDKEYNRLESLQEKQRFSLPHLVGKGAQAYLLFLYSLKKHGLPAKIESGHPGEPSAWNGTLKEDFVINLLEETTGIKIYKSKERIKGDYLLGIPDAFDDENWKQSRLVHEIKTTSNRVLFLHRKLYPVSVPHYLQVQGYMALTGKKQAAIHHCLVDYSEIIISDQKKKMFDYFCPDGNETGRFLKEWRTKESQLRFSEMKPNQRIFTCFIDRNDKIIEKIYRRVQDCRDWLNYYSELDEEVEQSGTCVIQQNSYSALVQKLG